MPNDLSHAHLILSATSYASDANIFGLRTLLLANPRVFYPELALRLLLTYLPESDEPGTYTSFVEELVQQEVTPQEHDARPDVGLVRELSSGEAQQRLRGLRLKYLRPAYIQSSADAVLRNAPSDPVVLFVIQRAHAIEKETGLLALVPSLVQPFLGRSSYLRVWYVSTVLPLLRFEHGYYQQDGPTLDLETFESFEGAAGVNVLMSRSTLASREGAASAETVGRDLRGTVGPWMYGSTQRKRRKLDSDPVQPQGKHGMAREQDPKAPLGKVEMSNEEENTQIVAHDQLEDWQHTFRWMVTTAADNFPLAVNAVEGWRGPSDVDLNDLDLSSVAPQDDQIQSQLHLQYCQAALATIYAAETDSLDAVRGAHRILMQVADMMGYPPPAELDTDLSLLPTLEQLIGEPAHPLDDYPQRFFHFKELLQSDQMLTMPTLQAFALLQCFVQSTFVLTHLGFTGSIAQIAKLCFYGDEADSIRLVQRLLHQQQAMRNLTDREWLQLRQQLLWLRDWNGGMQGSDSDASTNGIFRRLSRTALEQELLKAMGTATQFSLIRDVYISSGPEQAPLPQGDVEATLGRLFDSYYTAATNGNKTRGSLKKAADLLVTFQPAFRASTSFKCASALLSATHALSFYALTLEPGKPTVPSSIRNHPDPLNLISIALSQNPGSYTKLDDLIDIARNLVIANPHAFTSTLTSPYAYPGIDFVHNEHARVVHATRLVTGMAIDAALNEDDFETAYSYVVNRLSLKHVKSSLDEQQATNHTEPSDDTSWRAAYQSGRHRTTFSANGPYHERTRRLEQRMDLLSRALSLAPQQALSEILAAWRRCEEELLIMLQDEAAAEAEADELAEEQLQMGRGSSDLPGGFQSEEPALIQGQPKRKEIGRVSKADGEAPMGLFEVARGAAQAFGRMGQQGGRQPPSVAQRSDIDDEDMQGPDDGERVRKRDMVANAVTGGMAKGIGWMLGATPVNEQEQG